MLEVIFLFDKIWLKAAIVRAVKTFAQSLIATIGVTATIEGVDWAVSFSAAGLAAILSILTSIAGLPEIKNNDKEE